MIPQVGGFQGCHLDNHRNNWRCARAVRALCENAPLVVRDHLSQPVGFSLCSLRPESKNNIPTGFLPHAKCKVATRFSSYRPRGVNPAEKTRREEGGLRTRGSCVLEPKWPHFRETFFLSFFLFKCLLARGCHTDAQPFFFFLLRQPLSDVWWLPTNRHRLPTNRHRLHTNRHRLPTNRHQLPTGRHHRAYWTLRVFFFFYYGNPCY